MKKRYYNSESGSLLRSIRLGKATFPTRIDAIRVVESIKQKYICRKPPDDGAWRRGVVELWIRNFEVTPEEKKRGARGNYAKMYTKRLPDNTFTIAVDKIPVPVKNHPQRTRQRHPHPNFGHPVLRAVTNRQAYDSRDEAYDRLASLHDEFPNGTKLFRTGLNVYVFSRDRNNPGKSPIVDVFLHVKEIDGRYYIVDNKVSKALEDSDDRIDDYYAAEPMIDIMCDLLLAWDPDV